MSKLETITGQIGHIGQFTRDEHLHTYSLVEVESPQGRIDLNHTMASNELARAIKPGQSVSMVILRAGDGASAKNTIIGIRDSEEGRVFVNEDMYKLREHAVNQAVLHSLMGIVMIPVGLALFILPGLFYCSALWKTWGSIKNFPHADEIRSAVDALRTTAGNPAVRLTCPLPPYQSHGGSPG